MLPVSSVSVLPPHSRVLRLISNMFASFFPAGVFPAGTDKVRASEILSNGTGDEDFFGALGVYGGPKQGIACAAFKSPGLLRRSGEFLSRSSRRKPGSKR